MTESNDIVTVQATSSDVALSTVGTASTIVQRILAESVSTRF